MEYLVMAAAAAVGLWAVCQSGRDVGRQNARRAAIRHPAKPSIPNCPPEIQSDAETPSRTA